MKYSRWGLRCAAAAVCGTAAAATALTGAAPAGARTAAGGPAIKLVVAQNHLTVPRYGGSVYLDPGIYVASMRSPLVLQVQRASYTQPIKIRQLITMPGGGTRARRLPGWVLSGFAGLRNFVRLSVVNSAGKTVSLQRLTFCPGSFDPERTGPGSATNSPYPQQCGSSDPFPVGNVWGIARGWAVDPAEQYGNPAHIRLGTYHATETITREYQRLFHISARDASATVTIKVVKGSGTGPARPRQPAGPGGTLPTAPSAPLLRRPPPSALPDLVALPSWGINAGHIKRTRQTKGSDQLNFGATVWIGGNSPLDVEGFRSHGSPTMKAYQYFSQNGRIIGRARVGTMGFAGYNHWHFQQFATYRLLNSHKTLAVRSHKEGFCIAPTDSVDLVLPHATWQPSLIGLTGACGSDTALWVRETLPVGWGDTYFQTVPGQSFDITHLANGTYYIEVIANPQGVLHEINTSNDISLRQVILGGRPGHRTVRVPAWHGIDPEVG